MSCNCGSNSGNNVPCCCSQGSPVVCTTTLCPDAQVCDQAIESNCVTYSGSDIDCLGIKSGMNVTQVMDLILEGVNLINCSRCYSVINPTESDFNFIYVDSEGKEVSILLPGNSEKIVICTRRIETPSPVVVEELGSCSACFGERIPICITYYDPTDVDGLRTISVSVYPNTLTYNDKNTYTFSVNNPNDTTITYNGTSWIVNNLTSTDATIASENTLDVLLGTDSTLPNAPIAKTKWQDGFIQSTSIGLCKPITRCTFNSVHGQKGGYAMEKTFNNLTNDATTSVPYVFILEDFTVNGVQYSTNQSLTIGLISDLRFGTGQDGGHYITNVSDWLTIQGPHDFICHDNMRVLDMVQGITYSIRVRVETGSSIEKYYYTNEGFAIGQLHNIYGNYTCLPKYPITTTSSKVRCVQANYYSSIERYWNQPSYTFTLVSMILNGVQYASGQTLVVNVPNDIVIGWSINTGINGGISVMNINDWLNNITNVASSGFVFHDDMAVIDKPTAASTYYIKISNSQYEDGDYVYSSEHGFQIGGADLTLPYSCQHL